MTDPRERQFAAERDAAIEIAHKAMQSSYIGKPPKLRGDAERMVDALISAGWGPQAPECQPDDPLVPIGPALAAKMLGGRMADHPKDSGA